MTDKSPVRVDFLRDFYDDMRTAGVPIGSDDPDRGDIRVYPQIKPVLIDWIRNYRTRLTPGSVWFPFSTSLKLFTMSNGEQPEVATALIEEFRNLCDIDFEKVIPPEQYDAQYKGTFIANFSYAIAFTAGPGDYDRLRELVFDPKSRRYSGTLITFYFGKAKNKDVPNVLTQAFEEERIGIRLLAAEVAGLRGFTQFLPEVRELNRGMQDSDDYYWVDRMKAAVHRLEKKHFANTHADSSIDDLIRDLDAGSVAPFAAYVLGVRKDSRALEPLRHKMTSPITRLRQEARAAVKKLEKHAKP